MSDDAPLTKSQKKSLKRRQQRVRQAERSGGLIYADGSRLTASGNRHRVGEPNPQRKAKMRREVFRRDGFQCQMCGTQYHSPRDYDGYQAIPGPRGLLTLGHFIAHSKGGRFTVWNLQAECEQCNLARGAE